LNTLDKIRANLPAYPIEVTLPDIDKWKQGNTGVDYVHTFDSGVAGPHVMIMALTHGNEVSGAITLDLLLQNGLRPLKGRVTLGFANVDAYKSFNKDDPDASRYVDEDMNRVWSKAKLDSTQDSVELRRARLLRPIVDTVDLLLDMHSMHEESPALMMCGALVKGMRFAAEVGAPEHVVADPGHLNGSRLREYGGFGDPYSLKNALLIESGQHFSLQSKKIAMDVAARFLITTGAVAEADLTSFMLPKPASQRFREVTQPITADTMDFEFTQDFRGLELIEKAGTVLARDGERELLSPYDQCVMIMPSLRHLGPGVTVLRLAKVLNFK
jgi:succinylglutamate desuccinylase